MSRDILDLAAKGIDSPLSPPDAPPPGNYNTFDPDPWLDFLWEDIGASFGLDLARFQRQTLSGLDAVGLSLALQCADVKARDIAKSEMQLWRRENRQWIIVEPSEHPFARMLARKPNDLMTWTQFWRMLVLHYEMAQNAYILKRINRRGEVIELIPCLPARVLMRVSPSGRIFYQIDASTEFEKALIGANSVLVPASQMIHVKGRLWNGAEGLSNVALGAPIFTLLNAIASYQRNLFSNDGKLSLVFETDQAFEGPLADGAFRRLKEQLAQRTRRMAATGDPILLEAGLRAKQISANARDSMTAESFNAMVMRVCGLMQTPPHKIFAYETVKYDNQSAANNQYANDALIPVAKAFEEALWGAILPDEELDRFYPEFDRMPMMAGDLKTMVEVIDKAVGRGVMEVNEARDRLPLGLNPIEGGDVRYVPVNTAIVDRAGNVLHQTASGQNDGAGQGGSASDPADREQGRSLRLVSRND